MNYSALDDSALLALLLTEGDRLPMSWAAEAISRGQRLLPLLAATALERKNWERDDVAGWAPLHACFILGAIGGDEAARALLKAFDLSAEFDNDWLFDEWPSIFGRLGPCVLEGLKERAKRGVLDEFWTDNTLSGMAAVASRHPERREEVFSFIAGFAADERESTVSRALAGSTLLDFRLKEHRELLLELAELEENDVFLDEAVDRELAESEPDLKWYQHDWLEFYLPENIAGRQERWNAERLSEEEAWYAAVDAAAAELDELPPVSQRKAEAKLGNLRALAEKVREMMRFEIEELDEKQLLECRALALELRAAVRQEPARWRLFDAMAGDLDLSLWLIDLPQALADKGLIGEAESLGLAWADVRLPDVFLSDRAMILARAGRAPLARAQVQLVRKLFGGDFWMEVKVGGIYAALKDWAEAASIYRSARHRAPHETGREHVTSLLAEVLRAGGKAAEAEALEAEERANHDWELESRRKTDDGPRSIVRQGPKIGRNDPCSCGSGKKFKKCCLGKAPA